MFTKKKFVEDLGTFTTRKRLADYLGYKDPHCVDRFLRGLERIAGTRYMSADVYDAIVERGLS